MLSICYTALCKSDLIWKKKYIGSYRWPKHICEQMPSFSFTCTSTARHLHMCILMNVWSTPTLGPSQPSTVHDELLSSLATCKIKNIKHGSSSNHTQGFIRAQCLFVCFFHFHLWITVFCTSKVLSFHCCNLHCLIASAFMLQVSYQNQYCYTTCLPLIWEM